ncbi:MAG: B12-binding domain-containing radical SAM protein [Candidatus Hodarchaeota archaeon]
MGRSKRKRYGHDKDVYIIPPYNEATAAACLERDGSAAPTIVDCQLENLDIPELIDIVAQEDYDTISARLSFPCLKEDLEIFHHLRNVAKNSILVGWGPMCRVQPEKILRSSAIDVVIQGDFVDLFPIMVKEVSNSNEFKEAPGITYLAGKELITNPEPPLPESLDHQPFPAYHLTKYRSYLDTSSSRHFAVENGAAPFLAVLASKGCSYKCPYCPYPIGFGEQWRSKSIHRVVDELEFLAKKYSIRRFWFRDQTWNANIKRAEVICEEIIARDLQIHWRAELRADRVTEQLAFLMKRSGCILAQCGLETANPTLLRAFAKPTAPAKKLINGYKFLKKAQVNLLIDVIVGWPGETWDSIKQTYRFLKVFKPNAVLASILIPFPGTKFYDQAREQGWIFDENPLHYNGYTPVLRYPDLEPEEIMARRRFLLDYSKPSRKLKALLDAFRSRDAYTLTSLLKQGIAQRKDYLARFLNIYRNM